MLKIWSGGIIIIRSDVHVYVMYFVKRLEELKLMKMKIDKLKGPILILPLNLPAE